MRIIFFSNKTTTGVASNDTCCLFREKERQLQPRYYLQIVLHLCPPNVPSYPQNSSHSPKDEGGFWRNKHTTQLSLSLTHPLDSLNLMTTLMTVAIAAAHIGVLCLPSVVFVWKRLITAIFSRDIGILSPISERKSSGTASPQHLLSWRCFSWSLPVRYLYFHRRRDGTKLG